MKLNKKQKIIVGSVLAVLVLLILIRGLSNNGAGTDSQKNQSAATDNNAVSGSALAVSGSALAAANTLDQENSTVTAAAITEQPSEISKNTVSEVNTLIKKYYDVSKAMDKNILKDYNQKDVDQTIAAIKQKRVGIEKYKNINTYVKAGLDQNSYVVFTTYQIKLNNINTLVPGMSVLSVTKDDKGVLRIDYNANNADLKNYITELSKEDDIKKLVDEVNSKLSDAVKKDSSLKDFINYLKSDS